MTKEFCDASVFNSSCCYCLGLGFFEREPLQLCPDGALVRSGKVPALSHAPAALPFLLSSDETSTTKQGNHGMVAGAASHLNEVSLSKEHPWRNVHHSGTLSRGHTKHPASEPVTACSAHTREQPETFISQLQSPNLLRKLLLLPYYQRTLQVRHLYWERRGFGELFCSTGSNLMT